MEEGKQKKSRKTDDEAEIGQRQFDSDSVLAGRFFPVKMGVGWRRLWRLSRARCTFFFVQGGPNIINARRTCRYDHPLTFGCRRGVDPKVWFRVNFICERLNV